MISPRRSTAWGFSILAITGIADAVDRAAARLASSTSSGVRTNDSAT
jgi:hypothetical protein